MKIFEGVIRSISDANTIVLRVERFVPHPIYKKLMRKNSIFKADSTGFDVKVGDKVKIIETKPISKGKAFKIYKDSKKEAKNK